MALVFVEVRLVTDISKIEMPDEYSIAKLVELVPRKVPLLMINTTTIPIIDGALSSIGARQ